VTPRAAVARHAVLAMSHPQASGTLTLVDWTADSSTRRAEPWPRTGPVTTSHFLPAHAAHSNPGRLGIADIIVCSGEPTATQSAGCLRAIFWRYPGCAVAAAELGAGQCLAGPRDEAAVRFTVRRGDAGPRSCAFVCAAFMYGWLVAGWPLAALDPAQLRVISSTLPAGQKSQCPDAVMSLSFSAFYEPASLEPGASSRSCTSSASGAPICE